MSDEEYDEPELTLEEQADVEFQKELRAAGWRRDGDVWLVDPENPEKGVAFHPLENTLVFTPAFSDDLDEALKQYTASGQKSPAGPSAEFTRFRIDAWKYYRRHGKQNSSSTEPAARERADA